MGRPFPAMHWYRSVALLVMLGCTTELGWTGEADPPAAGQPDGGRSGDGGGTGDAAGCASPSRTELVAWLSALPSGDQNRVLSGFFGGYSATSFSLEQTDALYAATGQYPGVLACDYGSGWNYSGTLDDYSDDYPTAIDTTCTATLVDWWRQGGLVSINLHPPRPTADMRGFRVPLADLAALADAGSDEGSRWHATLDGIAAGLGELRDAGAVVLFRPLHEMNGDWFWWGAADPADLAAAWRAMHDYLTDAKGLDNLIWVFSPDCNAPAPASYYPGDDYVDLLGLDCYRADPSGAAGYEEMVSLGRPFAFSEIGPSTAVAGTFDYRTWIQAIREQFPATSYFLAWNDVWGPVNNLNASELMNDAWVVNRGEIASRTCP